MVLASNSGSVALNSGARHLRQAITRNRVGSHELSGRSFRSAGRRASENRQLGVESTLEGRPRFAAGDIGGEVRIVLQHTRSVQPAQHRHHQQVAGAERAVEPVGIAEPAGKLAQPGMGALFEGRDAAGKGGAIKRITEYLSPRVAPIVALPSRASGNAASGTTSATSPTCQAKARSLARPRGQRSSTAPPMIAWSGYYGTRAADPRTTAGRASTLSLACSTAGRATDL